jgi:hypothetical protein
MVSWNLYPIIAQLYTLGRLQARLNMNVEMALNLSLTDGYKEDVGRILQTRQRTSKAKLENLMGTSSDEAAPISNKSQTVMALDGSIESSEELYNAQKSI